MISVQEFSSVFSDRHDFEYEDSMYLSDKYKSITFLNIPEAWVCLIDEHLSKLKDVKCVRSVSQVMGFLVLDTSVVSEYDKKLLVSLDKRLASLDIDLYKLLDEGILLH